jgi:hypothetical protein
MPSALRKSHLPANWGIVRVEESTDSDHPKPPKKKRRRRRTLRFVYSRKLKPMMVRDKAKAASFRPYVTALNHWEKYWQLKIQARQSERQSSLKLRVTEPSVCRTEGSSGPKKTKIAGPPISKINRAMLEDFREWLATGRESVTVNNLMKSILRILDVAVDRDWLEFRPKVKQLREQKAAAKRVLTYEQVSAIYRAAEVAKWPRFDRSGRKLNPANQWRAAIVLWFNFGFRTQEITRYDSSKRAVTWDMITRGIHSPGLVAQTNQSGWLTYTPPKQEGKKPEPLTLALPPVVRAHIDSTGPVMPGQPIFDWPLSKKCFHDSWKLIVRAADVGRWWIKDFRKTCTTWHNYHSPGIAPHILGHAPRNVSDGHYHNPELATTRALLEFPQPEAFDLVADANQLKLF